MRIQSTSVRKRRPTQADSTIKAHTKEQKSETEKKSIEGLTLPPNARHHWDESKAKWVRGVKNAVLPLLFRREYEGLENIPGEDSSYILGSTHQGMFDAMIAAEVPGKRPFGSMAAIDQFSGPIGKMLAAYGTFPVDRYKEYEGDLPDPIEHAAEILDQGRPFVFYPEGRIYEDKQVYPLKTGIGRIGMNSTADYTLPVAQHFGKDTNSHPWEALAGGLLSIAAGAGVYLALGSNPGVAGGIAGLFAGAAVGGIGAYMAGAKKDTARRTLTSAAAAGIGALAGVGLGATLGANHLAPEILSTAAAGLTGVAGLGATYHWTHRPVARMKIGKPIALEPHRQRAAQSKDPDAAWKEGLKITAEHHKRLAEAKFDITGEVQKFKMDEEGKEYGLQEDGTWVRVERNDQKEWVPITELD